MKLKYKKINKTIGPKIYMCHSSHSSVVIDDLIIHVKVKI